MSRLSGDLVRHKLATRVIGQNLVYTEQTGSTNTDLKALAQQGAPEGMLYLTNKQVAGRGRLEQRQVGDVETTAEQNDQGGNTQHAFQEIPR